MTYLILNFKQPLISVKIYNILNLKTLVNCFFSNTGFTKTLANTIYSVAQGYVIM